MSPINNLLRSLSLLLGLVVVCSHQAAVFELFRYTPKREDFPITLLCMVLPPILMQLAAYVLILISSWRMIKQCVKEGTFENDAQPGASLFGIGFTIAVLFLVLHPIPAQLASIILILIASLRVIKKSLSAGKFETHAKSGMKWLGISFISAAMAYAMIFIFHSENYRLMGCLLLAKVIIVDGTFFLGHYHFIKSQR